MLCERETRNEKARVGGLFLIYFSLTSIITKRNKAIIAAQIKSAIFESFVLDLT
jgi:hypothetical protein